MPRLANPVQVGRMACPGCNNRIPVYINKRGYFYTKCAECGTDQRNGKAVQTLIYLKTDWLGDPPRRPGAWTRQTWYRNQNLPSRNRKISGTHRAGTGTSTGPEPENTWCFRSRLCPGLCPSLIIIGVMP